MTSKTEQMIQLQKRLTRFGIDTIVLCKGIPETTTSRPIISQLVRSATSIGANYAEATSASSIRDFSHKISLAKKEAEETLYWIEIADGSQLVETAFIKNLREECKELILIFGKISSTIRAKSSISNPK